MNAMPTTHFLPMALTEGMKGCGGCHRIGLKSEEEIETIKAQDGLFGLSSCDVCHTRHLFAAGRSKWPKQTERRRGRSGRRSWSDKDGSRTEWPD
ncbi:MAG: hypothetical protein OXG98_19175 [Gemmatimonadetes bacterium]|nr:hypothetical protein [Gemmatimonadota bacterium]